MSKKCNKPQKPVSHGFDGVQKGVQKGPDSAHLDKKIKP